MNLQNVMLILKKIEIFARHTLPDHNRKLLSQSQIFDHEIAARTEEPGTKGNGNAQHSKHYPKFT
jgi:hypothetical protein